MQIPGNINQLIGMVRIFHVGVDIEGTAAPNLRLKKKN